MQIDLSQYHTWHLIRAILLRANSQYHSGGISSGRCPMSYVYDAWESTLPYTGPQLMEVSIEKLIAELHSRAPLSDPCQQSLVFPELSTMDFVQITALVVNSMWKGHVFMKEECGWEGLTSSFQAVVGVRDFLPDKSGFLPDDMFEKKVTASAQYPPLKAIAEELWLRRDRIMVDPYNGIQPAKHERNLPLLD